MVATSQWWKARTDLLDTSSPRYLPVCCTDQVPLNDLTTLTDDLARAPIGTAGRILTFRVRLDGAPGVGKSFRFQLRFDNVASTTFDVTISDTATSGVATGTVSTAEGTTISIYKTVSGVVTSRRAEFDIEFMPDTANYYCYFTQKPASETSSGTGQYFYPFQSNDLAAIIAGSAQCVFPLTGTIRALYVTQNDAGNPFSFQGHRTFSVNLAGSSVGTSVELGPSSPRDHGGVSGMAVPITAGQLLCVQEDFSGQVPPASNQATCVVIESAVDGEFAWMEIGENPIEDYVSPWTARTGGSDTEADVQVHAPATLTANAFWFFASGATATLNRDYFFRVNGADGNLTVSPPSSDPSAAHDTTHSDDLELGDLMSIRRGAPAATSPSGWAMALAFGPASTTPGGGSGGGNGAPRMAPFHPAQLERFGGPHLFGRRREAL